MAQRKTSTISRSTRVRSFYCYCTGDVKPTGTCLAKSFSLHKLRRKLFRARPPRPSAGHSRKLVETSLPEIFAQKQFGNVHCGLTSIFLCLRQYAIRLCIVRARSPHHSTNRLRTVLIVWMTKIQRYFFIFFFFQFKLNILFPFTFPARGIDVFSVFGDFSFSLFDKVFIYCIVRFRLLRYQTFAYVYIKKTQRLAKQFSRVLVYCTRIRLVVSRLDNRLVERLGLLHGFGIFKGSGWTRDHLKFTKYKQI